MALASYPQDAQSAVEMLIVQRSQIAAFSSHVTLAACPKRPYIPPCAEHGAGVGRSNTGRLYEAARKGRSGKSVGVVDETATGSENFFGPAHGPGHRVPPDYNRRGAASAPRASGQPADRGFPGVQRGAVPPAESSPGLGRSSWSCISGDLPL